MSEGGEKSFAPTEKRLRNAARKGDVLRSRDLSAALSVLAGIAALALLGPWLADALAGLCRAALTFDRGSLERAPDPGAALAGMGSPLLAVALAGFAVALLSAGGQLMAGSGRWNAANLAFKGQRINPASGLKRVFGPTGWIELGKSLLKVALLSAIVWLWGRHYIGALPALARAGIEAQARMAFEALVSLGLALGGGLAVIAALDLPIQMVRRSARLKMTHREVRDEAKESDGSPEMKAHRRQRQRDIATGSVAPAMREAQFVVTNPTHFAIALAYDPAKAPAPVVLAKGRGEKALAIRELAGEHALPVLEYPQLARSLYYTTREQQMIREELYGALATLVAFVLALGRGETPPFPRLSVPVDLQFDVDGRPALKDRAAPPF